MKKLKTITAFIGVTLMTLTFLAGLPVGLYSYEGNVCEVIYYRCILQALTADENLLATATALHNCEIMFIACQVFMSISFR